MKKVGDWELHIDLGVLRRDGDEVQLTPRSMSVLTHLVERPGELVSADSLLETYWQGSFTADNAVAKAISEIRQVFGDEPKSPTYIKTIARRGYTLIAPVTEIFQPSSPDATPPVYKGSDPYAFISYARKDTVIVHQEINSIAEMGVNVWYDKGIAAGSEWTDSLAQAIENASLFIYFITPDSAESQNCRNELNFAIEHDIPVVAVHLKKTDLSGGLSLVLSGKQAILKHELPIEDYQQNLRTAVSTYLDRTLTLPASKTKSFAAKTPARLLFAGMGAVLLSIVFWFVLIQEPAPTIKTSSDEELVIAEKLAALSSIAVMPFQFTGAPDGEDVFAFGLVQKILDQLSQTKRHKVASRTDSMQMLGEDSATIGQKLNVAYVLDGTIRQEGDELHITTQLIRTADGTVVWSKSFEGTREDGFATEEALAVEIATLVEVRLREDIFKNGGWKLEPIFAGIEPAALAPYLAAFEEMNRIRLGEGGNYGAYMAWLNQAIEIDPHFHRAHTRMAGYYWLLHSLDVLPIAVAKPAALKSLAAAIKSVEINPATPAEVKSGVLYVTSAQIQMTLELDYASAEAGATEYLKRYPEQANIHLFLAQIALREGRIQDAIRHNDYADIRQSFSGTQLMAISKCNIQIQLSDSEGALETTGYALDVARTGPDRALLLFYHSASLIELGRADEAKPFAEEGWKLSKNVRPEIWVYIFARLGETERARKIITDAPYPLNQRMLAWGHIALGDVDSTFASLRAAVDNQSTTILDGLLVAKLWDPIRDDPRFEQLLRELDSKVTHTEKYLLAQDRSQL